MSILDWIFGDDTPDVNYTQNPQQQQIWNALAPMLQRIAGSAGRKLPPNRFLTNWNQGLNPAGQRMVNNPVSRAKLGTVPQAYATRATNGMSPDVRAKIIANMNRQRLLNNKTPIVM